MVKKQKIIIIVVAAALVLLLLSYIPVFWQHMNASIYIFSDVSEWRDLEDTLSQRGEFQRYTDTVKDKHLKNLEFTSYFAGEYSGKEGCFEIYAYVFADTVSAQKYFERATGKSANLLSTNFSMSTGFLFSDTRLVVYDENRLYIMYCTAHTAGEVLQILEESFTIKIR